MGILSQIYSGLMTKVKPISLTTLSDSLGEASMNLSRRVPGAARDFVHGEGTYQFLRQEEPEVATLGSKFMQTIHSSDYLMNKYEAGKKMVDDFAETDVAERVFKNDWHTKVDPFRKMGDESRAKVFQALEARVAPEELSAAEKVAYDVTKSQYDFAGKTYTKYLAGGDEGFNSVVRLHQDGVPIGDAPGELQEALQFYGRLRKNYAPHIIDKDEYLDYAKKKVDSLAMKASQTKNSSEIETLNGKISEYQNSIKRMEGGDPLAYESLPKDFVFRHQLQRKNVPGLEFKEDFISTYDDYVNSMARKMYTNAATQRAAESYYNDLPAHIRPYAKWYIRDFAGYNSKSVYDDLAGAIANFEYIRTLGFNLRSPLSNLTQQFNTIADVGPKWAMKGYLKAFTAEGKELWERSGLGVLAPTSLSEDLGPTAGRIDKLKRVFGYFFNMAENANRRHALNSYYERATANGLSDADALSEAVKGVHKTQFLYGRVGMPRLLRSPGGRVGFQYSSFSIKQAEFLYNLAKQNPAKFIGWLGMSGGANYGLAQALGIDLSNALGFGANFGEALSMVRSASQGEMEEAWEHLKLTFAEGSGILPTGPGPAVTGAMKIYGAISKGEKVTQTLKNELLPISYKRVKEIVDGIQAQQPGKEDYPRIAASGEYLYDVSPTRFFLGPGLKSTEESNKQKRMYQAQLNEQVESKQKRAIAQAIAAGDFEKSRSMVAKWRVMPDHTTIIDAVNAKRLPREMRKKFQRSEQKLKLHEMLALQKEE